MKAIFLKDVKAGDVIQIDDKTRITVRKTLDTQDYDSDKVFVHVVSEDLSQYVLRSSTIVALLRRPWPKDQTELDMIEIIERRCRAFQGHCEHRRGSLQTLLRKLGDAIQDYRLGEPSKVNKSLVDRHMMT